MIYIDPINNVDKSGIYTLIEGKKVKLEFISDPQTRILNEVRDRLLNKENQLCFLKEEIKTLSINEQLKKPYIKNQIKTIEKQFNDEVCNDLPNAFGIGRNMLFPFLI